MSKQTRTNSHQIRNTYQTKDYIRLKIKVQYMNSRFEVNVTHKDSFPDLMERI